MGGGFQFEKSNIGENILTNLFPNIHKNIIFPILSYCGINENVIKAFCNTHSLSTNDKNWDLRCKQLGDTDCVTIGEILKINTSLTEINICSNEIGDKGAKSIAGALKTNTSLSDLALSNNKIGDEGAKAIGEGLKTNITLKELYLRRNNISDAGAKSIVEALKINKKLVYLDLEGNRISETVVDMLK